MDIIFFIVRYTPFWSVPIGMISIQFAYIYWLKDIRRISYILSVVTFFCFLMTLYYLLTGGPDGSVKWLQDALSAASSY